MPKIRITLALLALLIYLSIPTKNYYWDGVSFAQSIETASNWAQLFHPNHLIYNFVGSAAYHLLGGQIRALYLLQALNGIFAAWAVYVLSGVIAALTESPAATLVLSSAFAFSGTFWRFATDADAYILSVLLLCICTSLLLLSPRPRPLAVALIHSCAMVIHELAFLFFPAVLFLLWKKQTGSGKRRAWTLTLYSSTAGIATIGAYLAAFYLQTGQSKPGSFIRWTTSHATDVHFSFQIVRNLGITLRSWLQLIFVGRPSVVNYADPFTIALLVLLTATLGLLIAGIIRRPGRTERVPAGGNAAAFQFALIWLGTYLAFLFFWLPNNTFYKLFALPAMVIAIASRWKQGADFSLRSPQTAAVAFMALFNLTFAIIPYSSAKANPAVEFALQLRKPLGNAAIVYFHDFNTDDWFARYWTPSAQWKYADTTNSIDNDLRDGKDVWLDTTAIDLFSSKDAAWFNRLLPNAQWHELVNAKHRIRFVRIFQP